MTSKAPATITEFVFYKIKPGHATRLLDTTTAEGQALAKAFTHIRNGAGCQRLAYGVPDSGQDILVTLFGEFVPPSPPPRSLFVVLYSKVSI